MSHGVRMMNEVSINYVDLNKSCSLLVAYWTINTMPLSIIPQKAFDFRAKRFEQELAAMQDKDRASIEAARRKGAIDDEEADR